MWILAKENRNQKVELKKLENIVSNLDQSARTRQIELYDALISNQKREKQFYSHRNRCDLASMNESIADSSRIRIQTGFRIN